jgi:hypothetical protein
VFTGSQHRVDEVIDHPLSPGPFIARRGRRIRVLA